jgi:spore germination protein Q
LNFQNPNPYLGYGVSPQGYQAYGRQGQFPQFGGQFQQGGFPPVSSGGQMPPSPPPGQFQQLSMNGGASSLPGAQVPGMLPLEASYVENILRLNKGKLVTAYLTFENNKERNNMVVKGIIEAAGRDHLILSDPQTGKRYLLLMVYLDYVTFDEEIEYEYPFSGGSAISMSSYPPR